MDAPDVARADDDRDVDVELPRCGDDVFRDRPDRGSVDAVFERTGERLTREFQNRAAGGFGSRVFGSSSLIPS